VRIAVDVSHLNHERLSGIGIYTVELLRAMRALGADIVPVFRPTRVRHRAMIERHAGPAKPWLAGGLGLGADAIFGPDFRVPRSLTAARIVTVLDLSFLEPGMTTPRFAAKKHRELAALLDRQTPEAIIAISDATRRAIVAYRPQLADRVFTTLLGGDHVLARKPADAGVHAEVLRELPYFLFVGNIEARKNIRGLLTAFERFGATNHFVDLLLIGKPGYDSDAILGSIGESPLSSRITVLGYCDASTLHAYYRHALALVYPSWLEGFGIPVLEAMVLGCPVITSSITSTAEITGVTGWTVDPANPVAIADAMNTVAMLTPAARGAAVERGAARAAEFTWRRCAEQTLRVIEAAVVARKR
jgi:glycosyltransferase involved in cell wall biosynthesis